MSRILKVAMQHIFCDVHLIVTDYRKKKNVGCGLGSMHYLCFSSRYPKFYGASQCQNCRTSCPFGSKKCSRCGVHIAISEDKVCVSGKMSAAIDF